MKTRTLTLNGLRHTVRFWGSSGKPKLFFIHGWMDMGASFDFVCRHLGRRFFCIAPDLRGFGLSQHSVNPLGYYFHEYVADLDALLERVSPDGPARLVGHSMGGNIASLYAGARPERVSHLINLEGFGISDVPAENGPAQLGRWLADVRTSRKFKTYATLAEIAGRLRAVNPRLDALRAAFLAKHLSRKVRGGFRIAADPRHKWASPLPFRLENVIPFWKAIRARCLLVRGELTEMGAWLDFSDSLEEELARRLAHFPAGSERVAIPGCGHMMHHEKPEELARLIGDFLE